MTYPIGEHVKRFSIDGCEVSVFQGAVQKDKSEQCGAFLVWLLQVESIRPIRQFENLDALLQVISISRHMAIDLSFKGFLPLRVPDMEVGPHALINLAIQLIFVCLAHPTADFAEFPREVIDGALVKLRFILMTRFEGLDHPRQSLIIDVNGFDEVRQFVSQVFFPHERFTAVALEAGTTVIDITTSAILILARKGFAVANGHRQG